MKALEGYYQMLGVSSTAKISEVKLAFKKKCHATHPDRHPGKATAHSDFIQIHEAFVEITRDFESQAMQSGSEDPEVASVLQKCEEYVPGKVDIKGNGISIKIQHYKIWKKVFRDRYPDAIVGKQRRNSISTLKKPMDEAAAKGVTFIIRFKLKGTEDFFMKSKISVYDNDTIVVSGTSYYLWVMDYYKEFSTEVQNIWDERNKVQQAEPSDEGLLEVEEEDTPTATSSTECCGRDCGKIYDKMSDVEVKVAAVYERLNLFMDKQTVDSQDSQSQGPKRFGSVEEKLDEILFKLEESAQALGSPPSEGGKTYLVGPDRFDDLKAWFKEFCLKELKEVK